MSWIARDDAMRMIAFAIADARIEGPLNVTAPNPVRNADFARTLARVLRRPLPFPAPAMALRWFGGDFARELLLGGPRAVPAKTMEAGPAFEHATLEAAPAARLCGENVMA